jgi:hypothetical protein
MAKPAHTRHLYEIYAKPRPPAEGAIVPESVILELARQRGLDRNE